MDKIALVIQRYSEVTGGSEAEARAYAKLLRNHFEVEVITTTARDVSTWANELPAGEFKEDGVLVRRFPVDMGRSRYWEALYDIYLRSLAAGTKTTLAFQEEWIRRQGPHSWKLLDFLRENEAEYRAAIFFTYLYSPTYFGMHATSPLRNLLVPTLHDEPAAQMECFRGLDGLCAGMIFNTEAERQLAQRLWGTRGGIVAGFPVSWPETPSRAADPYVLYAGRIEPGKGCDEMIQFFERYVAAHPGVRLILIGKQEMKLPSQPWLEFRGFVPDETKTDLMAGAICLLMPSHNESFSIASLESMAAGVPVVAKLSPVLADHIQTSQCGRLYDSAESFSSAIHAYRTDAELRNSEGMLGRAYVRSRYSSATVEAALLEAISLTS